MVKKMQFLHLYFVQKLTFFFVWKLNDFQSVHIFRNGTYPKCRFYSHAIATESLIFGLFTLSTNGNDEIW